ncbi:AraC family transcriptional regulator [Rhodanobacter fulvus Jip2]|jgi:transcriptional regulator GlxA family with amidase domain|uniref:AraC family transcriptional regulator n=1 Tax=Rhodanobacter fulvus Jip2 TaxID=1163408 RepID=I4VSW3_9GAMM|nr:helix-turn-helix domain-containing protein [Rhodanobacter fulvus]EIL90304.1 AraC family transcriptional regulator [Rhodanobacter fulvus Jip2]
MTRDVGFLVYPGFVLLDLSGPLEAFTHASSMSRPAYRLTVASLEGGMVPSASKLEVATVPLQSLTLDTFIIVGSPEPPRGEWVAPLTVAIREMAARSRRTACVCTGAFLLAASGLLDGRAATTHWSFAPQLQERYPALRVDGDRMWTEQDGIWTSAGMSAGIDMSLAMIERDLGKEAALEVARMLVVYYRRSGGQYQFSSLLDLDPGSDRIRRALHFAREHMHEDLCVERLAEVANLSVRQFGRVFASATGMTPARAVDRLRVEVARPLVEDGRQTFDRIARLTGLGDADHMCQSFLRIVGRTPQELRRSARLDRPSRQML